MDQLILIDTSWVIHRMWHVHQDLQVTLHNGEVLKTGHVYGVCRLLKSLTSKYPEADIICCLDGSPVHGRELCSDYKANRTNAVHTAFDDLGVIVECAVAFPRVKVAYHRALEADEVMSYYVDVWHKEYDQIIVYSGDCDMLQLLNEVKVFIAKEFNTDGTLKLIDRDTYYSDPKYADKFAGVDLSVLPLYRAMVGDSSDNLSGFPRLRKKVAKEIAESYRSVHRLMSGVGVDFDDTSIFPKGFKEFLPRLQTNYAIMKLPSAYDLEVRETVPHLYVSENNDVAQILYSLYRIRSASPVQTVLVDKDCESDYLSVRESVNSSWRRPTK